MDPVTVKEIGMTIYRFWTDYNLTTKIDRVSDSLEFIKQQNKAIASFLNILKGEITDFVHVPYKSAFQNLRYAHNASGSLKAGYLVEARSKFIEACTIERNEDLLLAHLGLALCQKLLGDDMNSNATISKAYSINYSPAISISASEKKELYNILLTTCGLSVLSSAGVAMAGSIVPLLVKPESWWVEEYNKLHKVQFERFKSTIFEKFDSQ